MARAVPEDPQFQTESEREVWERLVRSLPEECVVLAGLRITDEGKDHEADAIVLIPGAGVVVVEVKGGSVWVDDAGEWWQGSGSRPRRVDPVNQARSTKYAIRTYVERDPRWRDSSHSRIRYAHAVVVPYSDFPGDAESPDCPRWLLHDRGDQAQLAQRLSAMPQLEASNNRKPDVDDIDLIVEILTGRFAGTAFDPSAEADERESAADRLTAEQAILLKVTRLLRRVEVRGGAGSGKTVLALTQAKELSRGSSDRPAERVALVCYSIGLAEWWKRYFDTVPRRQRPAFVGTFHELGMSWGAPEGDRIDSAFWEEELPALMADLAAGLDPGHRFDSVIVDEAQDFADAWWTPLMKALRDEEQGGLYVYSDENQRIFQRFGRPPVELVPLVLDHNLRNTRQIAQVFGPLAPMRMHLRGGDGPEVTFVPSSGDAAIDTADEQVDALLDEGWHPGHVAMLTTGKRHPEQAERQARLDQRGYWATYWDEEDVFYGHVLGCKGLERRSVVLCLNESEPQVRAKERLYVGLSRATDRLVVVGDPEVVRGMGGPDVARRLGL